MLENLIDITILKFTEGMKSPIVCFPNFLLSSITMGTSNETKLEPSNSVLFLDLSNQNPALIYPFIEIEKLVFFSILIYLIRSGKIYVEFCIE